MAYYRTQTCSRKNQEPTYHRWCSARSTADLPHTSDTCRRLLPISRSTLHCNITPRPDLKVASAAEVLLPGISAVNIGVNHLQLNKPPCSETFKHRYLKSKQVRTRAAPSGVNNTSNNILGSTIKVVMAV